MADKQISEFDIAIQKEAFKKWLNDENNNQENNQKHIKECVTIAVKELSEKQMEYIVLFMNGNTQAEIAEICNVSRSTVSRTIKRGMKHLRSKIRFASPRLLHSMNVKFERQ